MHAEKVGFCLVPFGFFNSTVRASAAVGTVCGLSSYVPCVCLPAARH